MAETSPGVYETTSGWQSGAAVLQYHLQNVKYGSIVEVEFDRAISIPEGYKGNTKTYRAWAGKIGGTGTYNFYIGTPDGSWKFVWVEYITNAIRYTLDLPPTDGNYHREKYIFTYPTATGKTDGKIEHWIDGELIRTGTPWKLDGPNSSLENIHCIQLDTPGWNPTTNSYMRVKNVSVKVL